MTLVSAMVLLRREPAVGVWDCIWTIDEMQANKVVKGLLFTLHVIGWEKDGLQGLLRSGLGFNAHI